MDKYLRTSSVSVESPIIAGKSGSMPILEGAGMEIAALSMKKKIIKAHPN